MPNDHTLTRRSLLPLLGGAALLPAMPGASWAITVAESREMVDRMVGDILSIINAGQSEEQMYDEFEQIMIRYGDMPIIAQTVMGVDWRRASPAQRRAFTDAFRTYMSRKYGRQFRRFIGGDIQVTGARQIRNIYEVITTVTLRGEAPFEVIFLVSDGSGENRFFNMIIEGVNLRTTERTEVGAMLDRRGGDIDLMIQDLRQAG